MSKTVAQFRKYIRRAEKTAHAGGFGVSDLTVAGVGAEWNASQPVLTMIKLCNAICAVGPLLGVEVAARVQNKARVY